MIDMSPKYVSRQIPRSFALTDYSNDINNIFIFHYTKTWSVFLYTKWILTAILIITYVLKILREVYLHDKPTNEHF